MKALILFLSKITLALCLISTNAFCQENLSQNEQNSTQEIAESTQNPQRIQAVLETTAGKITLDLFPLTAPKAVENFVTHINEGYYNGTIFHRTIRRFMIQGGDPTGSGRGGESIWGQAFEDEIAPGYAFDRAGILAMANSGENTNGSQFFITTTRTPHLNGKHTIFGEISPENKEESFKTLRKIEYSPTDSNDKPLKEQKIIKAYIIQSP